jgi:hypothetical protein
MRSVCIIELHVCYLCTNIEGSTKRKFLWQIYVADNNKSYSGLFTKFPILLYDFNKIRNLSIDFYVSFVVFGATAPPPSGPGPPQSRGF